MNKQKLKYWVVERIVDFRFTTTTKSKQSKTKPSQLLLEHLVAWEGFGIADQTWEPLTSLVTCAEMVYDFHQSQHDIRKTTSEQYQQVLKYLEHTLPMPKKRDEVDVGAELKNLEAFVERAKSSQKVTQQQQQQSKVTEPPLQLKQPRQVMLTSVFPFYFSPAPARLHDDSKLTIVQVHGTKVSHSGSFLDRQSLSQFLPEAVPIHSAARIQKFTTTHV
jgi:hypothetical protein